MRLIRPLFALVVLPVLLVACGGNDDGEPSATAPSLATPSPTSASVTATPATATATAPFIVTSTPSPSPTTPPPPTPTREPTATPEPTVTPTPDPEPASQATGLPAIDAHYRIDILELDVASGHVRASELLTIRAFDAPPPDWLFLQVVPAWDGFFTLDAASMNGVPVTPEVRNEGVTLAFDLPPDAAAPFEIALDFTLAVGTDASDWAVTSRDGDVLRLGNWFPIVSTDHPYSDTFDPSYTASASFEVSALLPAGLDFAHTGEITGREEFGDGRVRYRMAAENVRDFALILSPSYLRDTGVSAGGVTVEVYTSGASEQQRATIMAAAIDALDQLAALVGPYPYATFRVADAGPSMPGGVEFPQLIYINHSYQPLERLIYHEVAHQWMYGILGNRTLQDGWIDEGGAEFFERGLPTGFSEIPAPPAGGYVYPLDVTAVEISDDGTSGFYYAVYEQGARLYYEVLAALGPDAFWAAMRELYDAHQFGVMSAWDVLHTWQEHAPSDLRPLFDEYFRYEWIWELPGPAFAGP